MIPKLKDFLGKFREDGEDVLAETLGLLAYGGEVSESGWPTLPQFLLNDFSNYRVGLPEIDAAEVVALLHERDHVVLEVEPETVLLLLIEKSPFLLDSLLHTLQGEENEIFVGGIFDHFSGLKPKVGVLVELLQNLAGVLHFLLVAGVEIVHQLFEGEKLFSVEGNAFVEE